MRYLDLAKNRIETLDSDVSGCEALEDLLLSSNMLQNLPDSIGMHTNTEMHNSLSEGNLKLLLSFAEDCCLFISGELQHNLKYLQHLT